MSGSWSDGNELLTALECQLEINICFINRPLTEVFTDYLVRSIEVGSLPILAASKEIITCNSKDFDFTNFTSQVEEMIHLKA